MESSVSPWKSDAWALDGNARNANAMSGTKCLPRGRRRLSMG
jgi:hypothetical protein